MIFLFVLSVFLGGSTCGWGHVPPNIAQLPKDFKTQPDDELIDMSDWGQSLKFSFRSRPPPHHLLFVTHGRVVVVLLGMLN